MTVFCSNCGKPNTEEASNCAACGHELKKGAGAKKFRGTMMMSTPPIAKPPGAASTPGSIPAPTAGGSVPPPAGPANPPSVAPVNKNIAFQKTMMGPMVTPPGASLPGSAPPSSVPVPVVGPGPGPGAPVPTPSGTPGFGTPKAPSQAGARSPTLLGTAPIPSNPQGFSGSPTADAKPSPGTFGLPGPGAYQPPPGQPVPVQPMGQPTAPAGSFGAAPSGSFGQTPTAGGFGQPPAGGFGAPSPFGGGDGGDDDKARKKKMLIFGGIGCLVIIILCCITAAVVVSKFKKNMDEAAQNAPSGEGMEGVTAELARIPLTFVLTQLMAQCKTDPTGAGIAPFFQPQVFEQLKAEGCAVDENVVTVFRDSEHTPVVNLATVPEGVMAKNLGLDPAGCFLFDAGKGSRIVTCRDASNATKIVHMEGIAQLRAQ